jgi:hypothetical protein
VIVVNAWVSLLENAGCVPGLSSKGDFGFNLGSQSSWVTGFTVECSSRQSGSNEMTR